MGQTRRKRAEIACYDEVINGSFSNYSPLYVHIYWTSAGATDVFILFAHLVESYEKWQSSIKIQCQV